MDIRKWIGNCKGFECQIRILSIKYFKLFAYHCLKPVSHICRTTLYSYFFIIGIDVNDVWRNTVLKWRNSSANDSEVCGRLVDAMGI